MTKPLPRWLVELPDGNTLLKVSARTKSEARGAAKKALKQTKRLPIGTTLERLSA